jgi:hypothetical protein
MLEASFNYVRRVLLETEVSEFGSQLLVNGVADILRPRPEHLCDGVVAIRVESDLDYILGDDVHYKNLLIGVNCFFYKNFHHTESVSVHTQQVDVPINLVKNKSLVLGSKTTALENRLNYVGPLLVHSKFAHFSSDKFVDKQLVVREIHSIKNCLYGVGTAGVAANLNEVILD